MVKTKRTDTVKKSVQPAFNESFAFKLTPEQQESASISVILMQYSMGHKGKSASISVILMQYSMGHKGKRASISVILMQYPNFLPFFLNLEIIPRQIVL